MDLGEQREIRPARTIKCQIRGPDASPMVTMGTCTTDLFLRDLAKSLARQLAEPATTPDDFLRLASTGEPVRRAAVMLEDVPGDVASLLATYEALLVVFPGPAPAELVDDALATAADLAAYRADDDQDGDAGLTLILELDAIVSAVVAAERTGRLPEGTADALAVRLESMLVGVSYRAPHLAQLAEDRWITVGDDPDLVGAYGWLDVLAEAAPSRARIAAIVKTAAAPRAPHRRRDGDPRWRSAEQVAAGGRTANVSMDHKHSGL